jgi:hypothetical protein
MQAETFAQPRACPILGQARAATRNEKPIANLRRGPLTYQQDDVAPLGTMMLPRLEFNTDVIKTLFIQEMARNGVLIIALWFWAEFPDLAGSKE